MAEQVTADKGPFFNVWDASEWYEHARVGDTVEWHGGWVWERGTITWLSDWRENEYEVRERLAVVAQEKGGLELVLIARVPVLETWQQGRTYYTMRSTGHGSGVALTAADTARFVARIREQMDANAALDRAIAETDPDNPDREWR